MHLTHHVVEALIQFGRIVGQKGHHHELSHLIALAHRGHHRVDPPIHFGFVGSGKYACSGLHRHSYHCQSHAQYQLFHNSIHCFSFVLISICFKIHALFVARLDGLALGIELFHIFKHMLSVGLTIFKESFAIL